VNVGKQATVSVLGKDLVLQDVILEIETERDPAKNGQITALIGKLPADKLVWQPHHPLTSRLSNDATRSPPSFCVVGCGRLPSTERKARAPLRRCSVAQYVVSQCVVLSVKRRTNLLSSSCAAPLLEAEVDPLSEIIFLYVQSDAA
jgi:hypothetical protein